MMVTGYSSKTTHNEPLDCIYVFLKDLIEDMEESDCVSVEAVETMDDAC